MMNKKGFTLIELLVVIAVLGILSAVVLVAINPAERLRSARDSGAKSDIGQIATALEAYYTDNNGTYPPMGTGSTQGLNALATGGYLKQVPSVPSGSGSSDTTYQYIACNGTATCTATTGCDRAGVWYDLEQAGKGNYVYDSSTGQAAESSATTDPSCAVTTSW